MARPIVGFVARRNILNFLLDLFRYFFVFRCHNVCWSIQCINQLDQ